MTDVIFGAQGGSGFSANSPLESGGIGLPAGREFADGWVAAAITALTAGVSGRGAARGVRIYLANVTTTPTIGVGAGGATPGLIGWIGTSYVGWVNGGLTNFGVAMDGSINFSRGGAGSTNPGGFAGTLFGGYQFYLPPTAPDLPSMVSPLTGAIDLTFGWNGDNGGAGVSGYLVQISPSPSFTSGVQERLVTTGGPHRFTGLTPGVVYYGRVTARNAVTDWAGRQGGAWSPTASVRVLSGVRYGLNGVWHDCEVYVGLNGAWVPAQLAYGEPGGWVGLA